MPSLMTTSSPTTGAEPANIDATSPSGVLRVLVADKFEASGLSGLERLHCELRSDPDLTPDALPDAIAEYDPDVLVVRSTKVRAPVFEAAGQLSLVIRAGAGYDNIDVAAASKRGVFVANCPGRNAIAVRSSRGG